MQPPPPTGWTGKAPPGFGGDGGAGVTLDEAAAVVVGVAPPGDQPTAKTSAATQAHNAAPVLAFGFVTLTTVVTRRGMRTMRARLGEDSKNSSRILQGQPRTVKSPGRCI